MIDATSRYASIEDAVFTRADGREIAHKRRRFVPPPGDHQAIGSIVVTPADRVDLIADRALGDPEQFWRLCDAGGALDPAELQEAARRLDIPLPNP